jgi:tetratricopeptide (TPR) repeat protein
MRYVEGETLARRIARAQTREAPGSASVDLESPGGSSSGATMTTDDAPGTGSEGAAPPRLSRDEIAANAAIVEKVARALHAAHELGVIHRDIKPANVMITPEGEPVLLDLGLARDESSDHHTLTKTGDVFGTPAYMSPEQLTGQRIRADRRTDVYALGATLYEALTLRRPFEAPTREALYQAILTEPPRDPRRINPRIPAELKVVIETALEKNRNRRYQTALALAQDLERVRKHEPIRARPAGPILRLRRWVQRRPATAAIIAGSVVALALLGYAIGAAGKASLSSRLLRHAEGERVRLDQAAKDAAIRREVEDLEMHLGTVIHAGPFMLGPTGAIDLRPLLRRYLGALEAYGLPLSTPGGSAATLASLDALRARDAALWGTVTGALEQLHWALESALPRAPGAADQALVRAQAEIAAVRRALKHDPWEERLREAELEWSRNGRDTFSQFLSPEAMASRSGSDLGRLAGALYGVTDRDEQAVRILDEALERDPGNYGLHVMRGGLALIRVRQEQDRAEVARACHHYAIARALRPRSGLVHCLLGIATVLKGEYQAAMRLVDEGTRLEPDSALIWLIAADFYSRSPAKDKAVAAARRASELDPSLTRAQELLRELDGAGASESR